MHIEFDCVPNRVHPSLFGGEHQRFFQLIVGILNAKKSKLQNHDSELTTYLFTFFNNEKGSCWNEKHSASAT